MAVLIRVAGDGKKEEMSVTINNFFEVHVCCGKKMDLHYKRFLCG